MGSVVRILAVASMWSLVLIGTVLGGFQAAEARFDLAPNLDSEADCVDCGDVHQTTSRFSMPLTQLGNKKYYLGIFFKANWYKAEQYCRFHGMHLASINKEVEQKDLEEHIESFGMGHEHFWTSGTDQAEEGKFFWVSTGKPVTHRTGMQENQIISSMRMENRNTVWNYG